MVPTLKPYVVVTTISQEGTHNPLPGESDEEFLARITQATKNEFRNYGGETTSHARYEGRGNEYDPLARRRG